ncbi:MAG: hypothetical protein M3N21_06345 [Actinomycetota bacterium]|nr:hypothetical protein [Actinomycetota bacterium]
MELHPHIAARKTAGPPKTADAVPGGFNNWLAVKITSGVGTMWCAYLFALIALISLPSVLRTGDLVGIVAWIAQTFLQLVLLSIIIVGQNIQAAASDQRAEATYKDADAVLHTALQIEDHLLKQDEQLSVLISSVAKAR